MAAAVVSTIARTIERREMLFDNHVITLGLLMLRREFLDKEEAVEMSLVDFFCALASVPTVRQPLVRSNVSLVLLRKLKTQHMPLETLAKIFKCELSLASEPANHHRMLEEGLLEVIAKAVFVGAAKESEIPNFKGSYLGRFPLVSADFWTSDHLSERSRSVDVFSGTRARGTLTLKRR